MMNSEGERLKTYRKLGWPEWAPVHPRDLAAAGLYYTGQGDKVACFSCKGCINNWESGDDPIIEHRRLFPKCLFIAEKLSNSSRVPELHATDSMPSVLPEYSIHRPPPPDLLVPSKLGVPAAGRLIHPLDLVTSNGPTPDVIRTCQYPKYSMENQRFDSYKRWPHVHLKPSLLARAGFFYSGKGDQVTCFYCGGTLQNWKREDDPWVEHARLFRGCEWLRQQKGPFFIEHVMKTS
ncbi:Baculoviral IAP repeat-containing protein 7-B [Holothuria leucospilota]|uniref:Baculoviral IAP repeat-containing protein 7-B n=1 Tax=Holothuria leucospilota TaxID=206669 RepID=A0A9Q1BNP8_HOLLE|nr:Baculoviral IAP repeat-containing protein 7-B [Holothuria leucospilota]